MYYPTTFVLPGPATLELRPYSQRCARRRLPLVRTSHTWRLSPVRSCAEKPDNDSPAAPSAPPAPSTVRASKDSQRGQAVVARAARAIWRVGWLAWWVQLVLTSVSVVILLFAFAFPGVSISSTASAPGLLLSACSAVAALASWFCTYLYTRTSLRLCLTPPAPLSRVSFVLKVGSMVALIGCAISLVAMQATIGTLLARLLSTSGSSAVVANNAAAAGSTFLVTSVQAVDLLVVQATVNALCSLFAGLLATLWLQKRMLVWKNEQTSWTAAANQ